MSLFSTLNGIVGSGASGFQLEKQGSLGTFTTNNIAEDSDACKLTSSSVVVAYRDDTDSDGKFALISDIESTPSTAITTFDAGSVRNVSVARLTDTSVVIGYEEVSSGDWAYRVVTGLDSTPSVGSATTFTPGGTPGANRMIELTSTRAVMYYAESGPGRIFFRVLSSLDSTPSTGAEQTVLTSFASFISAEKMTDTSIALVYNTGDLELKIATSLDGSPSLSSATSVATSIQSSTTARGAISTLSATDAVVLYADTLTDSKFRYLSSLDTTPVVGSEQALTAGTVSAVSVTALGSTDAAALISDSGTGLDMYHLTDLTGTPAVSSNLDIDADNSTIQRVVGLSANRVLAYFGDAGDSDQGKYQVVR